MAKFGRIKGDAARFYLSCFASRSCFFGRPRGRIVHSKPSLAAVFRTHGSLPNGVPRTTLRRSAFSSASVCAALTYRNQCAGSAIGQAPRKGTGKAKGEGHGKGTFIS